MTLDELLADEKEDLDEMNRDLADCGPPLTAEKIDGFGAFWRAKHAENPELYPMYDDDNGEIWFEIFFNWCEGDFTEEWLKEKVGVASDHRECGCLPMEKRD